MTVALQVATAGVTLPPVLLCALTVIVLVAETKALQVKPDSIAAGAPKQTALPVVAPVTVMVCSATPLAAIVPKVSDAVLVTPISDCTTVPESFSV